MDMERTALRPIGDILQSNSRNCLRARLRHRFCRNHAFDGAEISLRSTAQQIQCDMTAELTIRDSRQTGRRKNCETLRAALRQLHMLFHRDRERLRIGRSWERELKVFHFQRILVTVGIRNKLDRLCAAALNLHDRVDFTIQDLTGSDRVHNVIVGCIQLYRRLAAVHTFLPKLDQLGKGGGEC